MHSLIRFNGVLTALRSECFVLFKSRTPWLLIIFPAVVSVIKMGIIKAKKMGIDSLSAINGGTETTVAGYGFLVDGLLISLMITYLLLLGYAAYTFAIDRERGISRHSVVKSISRCELILAKYLSLCFLSGLSIVVTLLSTWLAASLFWDLGPLIEDGYQIIGVNEINKEIILGLKLSLLPLPACLAFGLLVSVCARSAIQAISMVIGAGLLLDIFKSALGDFQYFIFSSFQPALIDHSYLRDVKQIVSGYSDVLIDNRIHQLNIWVPIPEALLFLLLTLIVVHRRNL
jgi:ABC-type transport system involved in multi-copper enzyme maturation permease subunit